MTTVLDEIIAKVSSFFYTAYKREAHVIGIISDTNGWRVRVEIIEEDEYMQRRAKKDLLGIYEVMLNGDLEIVSYERIDMKERGTI